MWETTSATYALVCLQMRTLPETTDSKSTSGVFIAAVGPRAYAPIVSISKKQGCVSTSTCESEVVAMNLGLKEAMSILDLWQALELVFSGSGGSSAGAVADTGGSATTKRPGSSAGRDPGQKKDSSTPSTLPVPVLAYEGNQSTSVVLAKG